MKHTYSEKLFIRDVSEKGITTLGYLLTILLILSSLFTAYNVLPFYYCYYELRGEMDAKAVSARELSDKEITEGINQVIRKNNIPADIEKLQINRFDDKIVISIAYEEVFYVDFGHGYDFDIWYFSFNPKVERPL